MLGEVSKNDLPLAEASGSGAVCARKDLGRISLKGSLMTRTKLLLPILARLVCSLLGLALVWSASGSFALARAVPEIDPGSATSAVTLLAGSVLLLKSRCRIK